MEENNLIIHEWVDSMPIFTLDLWFFTLRPTWYGLMYVIGFFLFLWSLNRTDWDETKKDRMFWYTILGVVIGGRLGYVLFYNLPYYGAHLVEIFMPWKGGMSFHGGMIGVILAWYLFSHHVKMSFWEVIDRLVWIVPWALFFGRIGNLINHELLGLPGYSGVFSIMVDGVSYFPTPLLEAVFEGIILGIILYWRRKHPQYMGQWGVWFLVGYGVFRFFIEFVRMPDPQIGFIGLLTLGQILSIAMIMIGLSISWFLRRKKK